jgi:hypothetical protein
MSLPVSIFPQFSFIFFRLTLILFVFRPIPQFTNSLCPRAKRTLHKQWTQRNAACSDVYTVIAVQRKRLI